MTWHDGPLQSWYDTHEALRNEFPRLRKMANEASPDDQASLAALSDEVVFYAEVLTVHSLSEEARGVAVGPRSPGQGRMDNMLKITSRSRDFDLFRTLVRPAAATPAQSAAQEQRAALFAETRGAALADDAPAEAGAF